MGKLGLLSGLSGLLTYLLSPHDPPSRALYCVGFEAKGGGLRVGTWALGFQFRWYVACSVGVGCPPPPNTLTGS